eukprot:6813007-Prymnesium_polylepis.1
MGLRRVISCNGWRIIYVLHSRACYACSKWQAAAALLLTCVHGSGGRATMQRGFPLRAGARSTGRWWLGVEGQ